MPAPAPIFTIAQIFTWKSPDEKTEIRFAVSDILAAMAAGNIAYETITTPVEKSFARFLAASREPDRAYAERLSEDAYNEPVLFVLLPEGSHLLIDGTHRYYAKYLRALPTIDAFVVAYASVGEFMILKGKPL